MSCLKEDLLWLVLGGTYSGVLNVGELGRGRGRE